MHILEVELLNNQEYIKINKITFPCVPGRGMEMPSFCQSQTPWDCSE